MSLYSIICKDGGLSWRHVLMRAWLVYVMLLNTEQIAILRYSSTYILAINLDGSLGAM